MVARTISPLISRSISRAINELEGAAFNPLSLFAAGEQGVFYDPSDLSTLFQDTAGTIPVTAVEQPVGLMRDKSGRANHATQATATSRPVLSARVNLLTKSEQPNDASWVKTNTTITANTAIAPDGTMTASKLVENTASGNHLITPSYSACAGLPICSIYVKAAELTNVQLIIQRDNGSAVASASVVIDLQAGAVISGTAKVENAGNGWWRISKTATSTGANYAFRVILYKGGTNSYQGDGTSGIYIWGSQLELPNATNAPTRYQRANTATDYDTAGFPLYLAHDGVDDGMVTGNIDFSATDKMTVWAGVSKSIDTNAAILCELSADTNANNGAFNVAAPHAAAATSYSMSSKATVSANAVRTPFAAPHTAVLVGAADIAAPSVAMRVNATAAAAITSSQGAGNYGNYPLYIGRRGGATLPLNGRLYGLIVRGAKSTDTEIAQAEAWMNSKMGAY